MFKEFYNSNLSVPQQAKNGAIEALKKGILDETAPASTKLKRAQALIALLQEKIANNQDLEKSQEELREMQNKFTEFLNSAANEPTIQEEESAQTA